MREIKRPRQIKGEPRRRWFFSPRSELLLWLDETGTLVGFQFSYDKDDRQHSLTWRRPNEFLHTAVDTGEEHPLKHKAAPILVGNGSFDAARIAGLFRSEALHVPPAYVQVIAGKIEEFGALRPTLD